MNNCPNCKQSCNNGDCGCIPQGLTTPNYCPADLPTCPDPSPCNETFDSNCVYYTGIDLPCLNISTDDTVQQAIQSIAGALEPFFCLECITFAVPANAATNVPVNNAFTWNMVPGATCYDVYLGTSSTSLTLVSLGQILTTYTHPTPLLEGTVYYWQVVPRNDAGTPKEDCPIYSFTTFQFECVNPMNYILEQITTQGGLSDGETLVTVTSSILSAGLLVTNCNLCCPDCPETKRYVLSSLTSYSLYYESVYAPSCLPPCCIEIDATLSAYSGSTLITDFQAVPPPTNCCGTNFSECSERIKTILGASAPLVYSVLGIVEESTINGFTTLCILADFLDSLPSSFTEVNKANFLVAILGGGLVIDCRPEGTVISRVEHYIDYLTQVSNAGCLCYKPCEII